MLSLECTKSTPAEPAFSVCTQGKNTGWERRVVWGGRQEAHAGWGHVRGWQASESR